MEMLTGEFGRQGLALIGLRYRLIWAQARSSQGMISALLALYLLGALGALLFAFGGVGAAIAAIELGQGESICRWMLTTLYANGFGLSLLFGFGARAAFADGALRRFPLDGRQRFLVRHGIGIFDPVWTLLVCGALGLALGMVWLKAGRILPGLLAALLFILASYLTTAVLLAIVNRLMQTRGGTAILWGGALMLFSLGPLLLRSLGAERVRLFWRLADKTLVWLPPGVAAGMMVGPVRPAMFGLTLFLLGWIVGLALFLRWVENRPVRSVGGEIGFDAESVVPTDLIGQVSGLFGRRYGPLIDKSLRYHLRCNLIRYSLVTSPLLVVVIQLVGSNGRPGDFLFASVLIFYILSCATAAGMMLNLLGFDGAGVRRYAVMPAPLGDALRAGSLASMLLRLMVVLMAFVFWVIFYWREPKSWRMIAILTGVSLTGTVLYNGIGLWISIFSAKSVDFDSMWNNRLSLGANAAILIGVLLPFFVGSGLVDLYSGRGLVFTWWAPWVTALVSAGFYLVSFYNLDSILRRRSESIIRRIAGAN
ncbi:MAG: hypothetical protein EBZ36_06475 [Acidobacteria bacterium]|nr:hypothetical protein [Acidobacteriota bacterium]